MKRKFGLTRRQRQLTVAAFGLLVWLYLLIVYALRGQISMWTLPAVLGAMYLADAASGVAHFIVDYTPNVQGIGLKELFEYPGNKGSDDYTRRRDAAMKRISGFHEVVFDFKVHHLTPDALGRRSVLKMTLPVIVFAAAPATFIIALLGETRLISPHLTLFLLVLVGCGTVSQYAHACTHRHALPRMVRVLQWLHVFLSPKWHHAHHEQPNCAFCLLNGWANPLINRVFRFLQARGYFPNEGLEVR